MAHKTIETATQPPALKWEAMQILTPQQVADYLQIPLSAVYEKTRERCTNPLPVHQVGRYLRFVVKEVDEWFAGQLRKAA
jgi:excisionase family DNA binding protein